MLLKEIIKNFSSKIKIAAMTYWMFFSYFQFYLRYP